MAEYVIVLLFAVIVLAIPWGGQPAPILQLVHALQQFYGDFSYSLSLA